MNLVNEAALLSARRNKLKITMREFEDAQEEEEEEEEYLLTSGASLL